MPADSALNLSIGLCEDLWNKNTMYNCFILEKYKTFNYGCCQISLLENLKNICFKGLQYLYNIYVFPKFLKHAGTKVKQ